RETEGNQGQTTFFRHCWEKKRGLSLIRVAFVRDAGRGAVPPARGGAHRRLRGSSQEHSPAATLSSQARLPRAHRPRKPRTRGSARGESLSQSCRCHG